MQFQKKSIPTPWNVIVNSLGGGGGRGVLEAKILVAKYEAKLKYPLGEGVGGWGKPFTGY